MIRCLIAAAPLALCLATAAPGEEPAEQTPAGIYRFALQYPVAALDPQAAQSREAGDLVRLAFEGLFEDDPQGRPVPALAAAHEISADGLTWTFTLAPARWSDGAPVVAGDFVAAFRRLASPQMASGNGWLIREMAIEAGPAVANGTAPPEALGVRALPDGRLELRLARPVPHLRELLSHQATFPIPAHVQTAAAPAAEPPVVNGPFRPDSVTLERARFLPNPHYRRAGEVRLEAIEAITVNDAEAGLVAWMDGQIDRVTAPPGLFTQLSERYPEETRASPLACTYGLMVNLGDGGADILKNPDIRRALSLATDRERLVRDIMVSAHRPAYAWTDPMLAGFTAPENPIAAMAQEERFELARAILAGLGYHAEAPLRLRLSHNAGDDHRLIARGIAAMWREAGIIVSLSSSDWATHEAALRSGEFQIARYGWCADYNAPDPFLAFFGENGPNYARYDSDAYRAALADLAAGEADAASRAEALLIEDLPVIPLYHYARAELVSARSRGLPDHNPMQRWNARDISIQD
ncbi:MAG: peptide ABC transporter substrate-binding protein [Paracoccus sp. (in: a-proteobacteria)]|nr:peptide ABC transporter substrate-binding protein [Paracoccus sp. (in: a-proteobacteria)]